MLVLLDEVKRARRFSALAVAMDEYVLTGEYLLDESLIRARSLDEVVTMSIARWYRPLRTRECPSRKRRRLLHRRVGREPALVLRIAGECFWREFDRCAIFHRTPVFSLLLFSTLVFDLCFF